MIERFSTENIMWSLDGTPLLHDPNGQWVRYSDFEAALSAASLPERVDDAELLEIAERQVRELLATPLPVRDETAEPVMFVSPGQFANRANFNSDYMPFRLVEEGLFTQPLFAHPLPAAAEPGVVTDEADIYEQAATLAIPAIGGSFLDGVEEFRKQLRLKAAKIRNSGAGEKP